MVETLSDELKAKKEEIDRIETRRTFLCEEMSKINPNCAKHERYINEYNEISHRQLVLLGLRKE